MLDYYNKEVTVQESIKDLIKNKKAALYGAAFLHAGLL